MACFCFVHKSSKYRKDEHIFFDVRLAVTNHIKSLSKKEKGEGHESRI